MKSLEQATKRAQELDQTGRSDTVVYGGLPTIRSSRVLVDELTGKSSGIGGSLLRPAVTLPGLSDASKGLMRAAFSAKSVKNDPVDELPVGLEDELEKQVRGDW